MKARSQVKIFDYSYKPRYITRGNNNKNIFGMEIETEFINNDKVEYFEQFNEADYRNQIYLKKDSSLDNGLEIITQPASYDFINSTKFKLWKFIKEIQCCCNSFNKITCGMHIHIDKHAFNNRLHLLKFISFFQCNYNKIVKHISERKDKIKLKHYCSNIRKQNINQSLDGNYRTRFIACNVTYSTIEVRIFQANLRKQRILKNIEFVQCLINYTASQPNLKLSKSFAKFKKYLVLNKLKYANLYNFLILNDKTI